MLSARRLLNGIELHYLEREERALPAPGIGTLYRRQQQSAIFSTDVIIIKKTRERMNVYFNLFSRFGTFVKNSLLINLQLETETDKTSQTSTQKTLLIMSMVYQPGRMEQNVNLQTRFKKFVNFDYPRL